MPPGAENEDKEGRAMSEGVEGARRARYGWGGAFALSKSRGKNHPFKQPVGARDHRGPGVLQDCSGSFILDVPEASLRSAVRPQTC